MEQEYETILVCPSCHDIVKDSEMVYQYNENGIRYICKCEADMEYVLGLIVIGDDAACDCLGLLEIN